MAIITTNTRNRFWAEELDGEYLELGHFTRDDGVQIVMVDGNGELVMAPCQCRKLAKWLNAVADRIDKVPSKKKGK